MSKVLKAVSSIIYLSVCLHTYLSTCQWLSVSLYLFFGCRHVSLDYLVAQVLRVPDPMGVTFNYLNT